MMGADATLGHALARYLEVAKMEIQGRESAARPADGRLAVLTSEDQILLRAVEHAEKGREFRDVVQEAAALYYPEGLAKGLLSKLSLQCAEFFRVSGIYCDPVRWAGCFVPGAIDPPQGQP